MHKMHKNVEMRRSVFVSLGAGAIAFLCFRTLLLFSTGGITPYRAGPSPEYSFDQVGYFLWPRRSEVYKEEGNLDGVSSRSLVNFTTKQRQEWIVVNLPNFQILQSDSKSAAFSERVANFFQGYGGEDLETVEKGELEGPSDLAGEQGRDPDTGERPQLLSLNAMELEGGVAAAGDTRKEKYQCEIRVFMVWISPVSAFGPREQLSLESLFKTHPQACLVILSRNLDSEEGNQILQPFMDKDLKVLAVTPDTPQLFEGTPASEWYDRLKKGMIDPGKISLSQNLSNLMRLVALYKYGGLYLDNDIIVLRNFSTLGSAIGSQNNDVHGNWRTLNNAVLKFAKGHPVLLRCIHEFADTFNGNKWGHNGPFLVSRVLRRFLKSHPQHENWQCDILPPPSFYPVDWLDIRSFLVAPRSHSDKLRHLSTIQELEENSYTLHLWNSQTRGFSIQNGSILDTIFRNRCLFCNEKTLSAALAPQ